MFSPALYNARSKVDSMETDIPVAECVKKNSVGQKVALCCLLSRHGTCVFVFISVLDSNLEITQRRGSEETGDRM